MSKLETNTIDTVSGTSNLVIGSTNSSTVTFESGAATGHMSPAFLAQVTSDTTISDGVVTTMIFGTESYDTDSAYDNSNGRFTIPSGKAGKYFIYTKVQLQCSNDNLFLDGQIQVFKNGSVATVARNYVLGDGRVYTLNENLALDLAESDYIEVKAYVDDNGGTPQYNGGLFRSYFGAYRIGS